MRILYHYPDLQELLVDANRAGMERFHDERLKALEGVTDPARRLVITINSGLPIDEDDEEVRLLCALGGEAARNTVYAVLLTVALRPSGGHVPDDPRLGCRVRASSRSPRTALTIARNLVALEDAYGYRIMAGHPSLDHDASAELILDYARLATSHPLEPTT